MNSWKLDLQAGSYEVVTVPQLRFFDSGFESPPQLKDRLVLEFVIRDFQSLLPNIRDDRSPAQSHLV